MLVMVIGGAASGKSEIAERICLDLGCPRTYLATMQPEGEDAAARIERHRALRAGKGFSTVERACDLSGIEPLPSGTVLVECLGTLAANEMFSPSGAGPNGALDAIIRGIDALARTASHVVVVTNDVFADGLAYDRETARYLDLLAKANAYIAGRADCVIEAVCGIATLVKARRKACAGGAA